MIEAMNNFRASLRCRVVAHETQKLKNARPSIRAIPKYVSPAAPTSTGEKLTGIRATAYKMICRPVTSRSSSTTGSILNPASGDGAVACPRHQGVVSPLDELVQHARARGRQGGADQRRQEQPPIEPATRGHVEADHRRQHDQKVHSWLGQLVVIVPDAR